MQSNPQEISQEWAEKWESWVQAEARVWAKNNPKPRQSVILFAEADAIYTQALLEYRQAWNDHIKVAGSAWWQENGFFAMWPENPNEKLQIVPITEEPKENVSVCPVCNTSFIDEDTRCSDCGKFICYGCLSADWLCPDCHVSASRNTNPEVMSALVEAMANQIVENNKVIFPESESVSCSFCGVLATPASQCSECGKYFCGGCLNSAMLCPNCADPENPEGD